MPHQSPHDWTLSVPLERAATANFGSCVPIGPGGVSPSIHAACGSPSTVGSGQGASTTASTLPPTGSSFLSTAATGGGGSNPGGWSTRSHDLLSPTVPFHPAESVQGFAAPPPPAASRAPEAVPSVPAIPVPQRAAPAIAPPLPPHLCSAGARSTVGGSRTSFTVGKCRNWSRGHLRPSAFISTNGATASSSPRHAACGSADLMSFAVLPPQTAPHTMDGLRRGSWLHLSLHQQRLPFPHRRSRLRPCRCAASSWLLHPAACNQPLCSAGWRRFLGFGASGQPAIVYCPQPDPPAPVPG
ncbi:unnamed protein product [Coccothraustes coccothraustes]